MNLNSKNIKSNLTFIAILSFIISVITSIYVYITGVDYGINFVFIIISVFAVIARIILNRI